MNKEQELENRELQSEEIMAIEAIYPDNFEKNASSAHAFTFTLNLDEEEPELRSPRKVVVQFFLPPTYPNQDMPVYEISSIYCGTKKINDAMLEDIDLGFQSLFQPSEVVLFEWINWLREYLEENVEKQSMEQELVESIQDIEIKQEEPIITTNSSSSVVVLDEGEQENNTLDRPTVRSLMGPNIYHQESPPTIYSTDPLVDRKSTFIAHVAQVNSVHEVKVVVANLLQNKKIAKATHNILAYRIVMTDGKVLQDNDDDGESAAGGRLAHLLQILEVENVVVIVTRWFGGIHLGPDRFKDINNIARTALNDFGFLKKSNPTTTTKKQTKKK